ncbi:flagellar hook-associated protein FlgL [Shewanella sp. 202IG2-18]|uniref:flagellar hook-associated protein FlgL n=1 Tax=Parashewanella hymeniacidonis TaxID=2807618 RepID=UPI00196193E5|nr:flagellar hook-associated protein FlgL [Parashewanella hymeniacidonis]MBM7073048.1 flagellar hook-associated protein FlgL [Parashewanella hymeniacidonis]
MRISTSQMFNSNTSSILRHQADTQKSLEQISSGKRVNTAADDPIASKTIDNFNQQNNLIEQFLKNIDYAEGRLANAESSLGEAESLSRNIKDNMLKMNNGTRSQDDLDAIAKDLRSDLDALMSIANSKDESGNFVFAGFNNASEPFSFTNTDPRQIQYAGDGNIKQSMVAEGVLLQTNIPGSEAFMNGANALGDYSVNYQAGQTGEFQVTAANIDASAASPAASYSLKFQDDGAGGLEVLVNGTTPITFENPLDIGDVTLEFEGTPAIGDEISLSQQSSISIFDTVEQAISLAESGEMQNPNGQAEMAQLLDNINQGIDQISTARSVAGVNLKSLETYNSQHEDAKLVNTSAQAKLEDLDMAEAITELQKSQVALQATSSLFSRVSSASLFDYL